MTLLPLQFLIAEDDLPHAEILLINLHYRLNNKPGYANYTTGKADAGVNC
jgi:hypothetical protein